MTAAEKRPAARSVRVDFLWDGAHVGAALFDERLLAVGPVAVFEIPGERPTFASVAARFVARADTGQELGIEVLRVEPHQSGDVTTVSGFLVAKTLPPAPARTSTPLPSRPPASSSAASSGARAPGAPAPRPPAPPRTSTSSPPRAGPTAGPSPAGSPHGSTTTTTATTATTAASSPGPHKTGRR